MCTRRRSASTSASCRRCRRPARRARRRCARRARGRAASGSWCREIRVEHQPGARADGLGVAVGAQLRSHSGSPCGGPARRWRGAAGARLRRFHTSVVSRWLVMPMPAMSRGRAGARPASASRATASWVAQISSGSCSTQPGCGKICRNSRCAMASDAALRSKTMAARARRALVEGEQVRAGAGISSSARPRRLSARGCRIRARSSRAAAAASPGAPRRPPCWGRRWSA
jgi:hypothetical protein